MKYGTYGSEDLTACDLKSPVTLRCPRCFQFGHKECKSQSSRYAMPGRRPRHHVDHERPTKGLFISPEASRPPETAEHSQRNRCPDRSFHGLVRRRLRCSRCSHAGGRVISHASASRPLSRTLILFFFSITVTRRQHRLCFICKTKPLNAAVRRAYVVLRTSRRVAIV